MARRRRTLPPVPPKASPELRPLLAGIAELLETGEGVRGDPLDRKVTLRDLLDSGIGRLKAGARAHQDGSLESGVEPPQPDLSTPPAPEGFAAVGSFYGQVTLTWHDPTELYRNHSHVNIYRSEEDNFANARRVGRDGGFLYSDDVRQDAIDPDDPTEVKGYYYWITFVSQAGVEGPPNSPDGTYAAPLADMNYVLELVTGQVDESHLADALSQRIDLIDGVGEGSVAARIADLQETLEAADQALAEQITTTQASLEDDVAAVQQTLSAEVTRVDGELVELGAQWTAQVQAGGLIGGFGVYNDGSSVDAAFDVDRFWVGRTDDDKRKPFIIQDGVTYIDEALIRDAAIQEGQLGPITIGKLTQANGDPLTTVGGLIRADAIDADNLNVGSAARFSGDVFSGNFVSGKSGWAILQSGYVEFNEAMVRGNLEVQSITVNGNSPFGAIQAGGDDVNRSVTSSPSKGPQSFYAVVDGTDYIEEMPENSRLSLVVYPRVSGSWRGSGATSRTWTVESGGDPDDQTYTSHYRGGGSIHIRMRVRIVIDGVTALDKSETFVNRSYSKENISGSYRAARYDSGYTLEYTYPAYKTRSAIRVLIQVWGDFSSWGDDYTSCSGSTSVIGGSALSGDAFRLG